MFAPSHLMMRSQFTSVLHHLPDETSSLVEEEIVLLRAWDHGKLRNTFDEYYSSTQGGRLILTESFIVAVFWHLVIITIQAPQIELVNVVLLWKGMKSLGGFFDLHVYNPCNLLKQTWHSILISFQYLPHSVIGVHWTENWNMWTHIFGIRHTCEPYPSCFLLPYRSAWKSTQRTYQSIVRYMSFSLTVHVIAHLHWFLMVSVGICWYLVWLCLVLPCTAHYSGHWRWTDLLPRLGTRIFCNFLRHPGTDKNLPHNSLWLSTNWALV